MKHTSRIFILSIIFLQIFIVSLDAQKKQEVPLMDRFFFGGNFGIQFGTVTNIEISPLAGFYFTPRIAGGVGLRYEYYKDASNYPGFQTIETNIYGGNLFSRIIVIQNIGEALGGGFNGGIFGQVEYEILSLESQHFKYPYSETGRFNLHSILIGGGLRQPIGKRSAFMLTILWNLSETINTPYSNPIIRLGFVF